jgi:uncharacterized protein YacL
MNKIFKWKIHFLVGLSIFLIIIIFTDVFSIWTTPEEYIKVYEFSNNSVEWRYKSIFNYILSDIIVICFLILYIILNLIFLIKNIKFIKSIIVVIEVAVLIYLIYNFYTSYITGFDH